MSQLSLRPCEILNVLTGFQGAGRVCFAAGFIQPAVDKMKNREDRVTGYHFRAGVPHHLLDPLSHYRFVAVHNAFDTGGFCFSERTLAEPEESVVKEFLARATQSRGALMTALVESRAVDLSHYFYGASLAFEPVK